jgi:hypothetical protein
MPELEPATDEDELRAMRRQFRAQAVDRSLAPRDRHGAARLVLAIMAKQRALRDSQPPEPPQAPAAIASPALTMEQEAELVRQYLGKVAY